MTDNLGLDAASVTILSPPSSKTGFAACVFTTGTLSTGLFALSVYELSVGNIADKSALVATIVLCILCGLLMTAALAYGGYKGLQACGLFPPSDNSDNGYDSENSLLLNP